MVLLLAPSRRINVGRKRKLSRKEKQVISDYLRGKSPGDYTITIEGYGEVKVVTDGGNYQLLPSGRVFRINPQHII
jgi:hypothetical protein